MFQKIQCSACDEVYDAYDPAIAAIDLGTNSCRLLVARVNIAGLQAAYFRARSKSDAWRIIDSVAKVVRLGEGLHTGMTLSEDAIDRSIKALKIYRTKMDYHRVRHMRAVATEACRRATNTKVLIDRAAEEAGIHLEIISPSDEARLAIDGCAGLLNAKIPYALVFDIGGGSTEVAWIAIGKEHVRRPGYSVSFNVLGSISLPYGVVTLSEQYGSHMSDVKFFAELSEKIASELEIFFECHGIDFFVKDGCVQLVGTSGTLTTLAATIMNLKRYERSIVNGANLDISDLDQVCGDILGVSEQKRSDLPCVGGGRSDLVIAGSAILKAIYDRSRLTQLRVADKGVREGVLLSLLRGILGR